MYLISCKQKVWGQEISQDVSLIVYRREVHRQKVGWEASFHLIEPDKKCGELGILSF